MKKAKLFIDPAEYAGHQIQREKEFGELGKMEMGVQEIAQRVQDAAKIR